MDNSGSCLGEKETPGTLADGLFVLLLSVLFAVFFFVVFFCLRRSKSMLASSQTCHKRTRFLNGKESLASFIMWHAHEMDDMYEEDKKKKSKKFEKFDYFLLYFFVS